MITCALFETAFAISIDWIFDTERFFTQTRGSMSICSPSKSFFVSLSIFPPFTSLNSPKSRTGYLPNQIFSMTLR